jgi:DNA-binding winged helix-turn-helix (wHTH) protein
MEDCTLDLAAHIFVDAEGREVVLTRAETELLTELVRNLGQILSRDQLRHAIGGRGPNLWNGAPILSIAALTCSLQDFGGRSSPIQRFPDSS